MKAEAATQAQITGFIQDFVIIFTTDPLADRERVHVKKLLSSH
jgi:hypothetical protein